MTGFSPRTPQGFLVGLFLSALLVLFLPFTASGEFYKYVTDEGKTVFVDDIGKVPLQYRRELIRYGEKTDGLSPEKKAEVRERDRTREEALREAEAEEARLRREQALDRLMRTRVEIRNDRVMVPVTLGYGVLETRAVLVLDTGASMTTLYKRAVDRLYMRGIDRTFGRTAGGNRIEVRLATLDHLIVGPHRMEKIRVGIVDPPGKPPVHDGLLGMDFLRGLIYEIDFAKQEIVWKGVSPD
jgi:hypothetical protein